MIPDLNHEFRFRTSRSSGSGGQNVNKVATKVELIFYVEASETLSEDQKEMIREKLSARIRKDGAIHMVSQEARTQGGNKERVIARFYLLLEQALRPIKKRRKAAVSLKEKEKRLTEKKIKAEKKERRKKMKDSEN